MTRSRIGIVLAKANVNRTVLLLGRMLIGAVVGALLPVLRYELSSGRSGSWAGMAGFPSTTAIIVWAVIGALTAWVTKRD